MSYHHTIAGFNHHIIQAFQKYVPRPTNNYRQFDKAAPLTHYTQPRVVSWKVSYRVLSLRPSTFHTPRLAEERNFCFNGLLIDNYSRFIGMGSLPNSRLADWYIQHRTTILFSSVDLTLPPLASYGRKSNQRDRSKNKTK